MRKAGGIPVVQFRTKSYRGRMTRTRGTTTHKATILPLRSDDAYVVGSGATFNTRVFDNVQTSRRAPGPREGSRYSTSTKRPAARRNLHHSSASGLWRKRVRVPARPGQQWACTPKRRRWRHTRPLRKRLRQRALLASLSPRRSQSAAPPWRGGGGEGEGHHKQFL